MLEVMLLTDKQEEYRSAGKWLVRRGRPFLVEQKHVGIPQSLSRIGKLITNMYGCRADFE